VPAGQPVRTFAADFDWRNLYIRLSFQVPCSQVGCRSWYSIGWTRPMRPNRLTPQ
jgi:hypothetical protein